MYFLLYIYRVMCDYIYYFNTSHIVLACYTVEEANPGDNYRKNCIRSATVQWIISKIGTCQARRSQGRGGRRLVSHPTRYSFDRPGSAPQRLHHRHAARIIAYLPMVNDNPVLTHPREIPRATASFQAAPTNGCASAVPRLAQARLPAAAVGRTG